MNFNDNLVTNLISLFSFFVAATTFYFYFRDRQKEKYIIKTAYKNEILNWYSKTIEILILLRCCDLGSEREKHLANLSSQIEIGRFYFPNIDKGNGFGKEKPKAYQGYRNLVLDFLIYSYRILRHKDHINRTEQLEVFQREFTSLVFNILKPSDNLNDIMKLTNKYFAEDKIFEDYLKTKNSSEIIRKVNEII